MFKFSQETEFWLCCVAIFIFLLSSNPPELRDSATDECKKLGGAYVMASVLEWTCLKADVIELKN